jgi:hypothetical protein
MIDNQLFDKAIKICDIQRQRQIISFQGQYLC